MGIANVHPPNILGGEKGWKRVIGSGAWRGRGKQVLFRQVIRNRAVSVLQRSSLKSRLMSWRCWCRCKRGFLSRTMYVKRPAELEAPQGKTLGSIKWARSLFENELPPDKESIRNGGRDFGFRCFLSGRTVPIELNLVREIAERSRDRPGSQFARAGLGRCWPMHGRSLTPVAILMVCRCGVPDSLDVTLTHGGVDGSCMSYNILQRGIEQ